MAEPRLSPRERHFAAEAENTRRLASLEAQIEELHHLIRTQNRTWWAKLWRK